MLLGTAVSVSQEVCKLAINIFLNQHYSQYIYNETLQDEFLTKKTCWTVYKSFLNVIQVFSQVVYN